MNFKEKVTPKIIWALTTMVLGYLAVAAVPYSVTFDGHNYVAGSKTLFTKDAADIFWWLREPGYSIFIRLISRMFGPDEIWLTSIQTLMVLIGSHCAALAIWKSVKRGTVVPYYYLTSALIVGGGNAAVLYYSSAVLQQSLFVLFCGVSLFWAVTFQHHPTIFSFIGYCIWLVGISHVQEEFGRLMIIPMCLAMATAAMPHFGQLNQGRLSRVCKPISAILLTFILLFSVISVGMKPWSSYRASQIAAQTEKALFLDNAFLSISEQLKLALAFREPHRFSAMSHLGAFLGFRGSSQFLSKHYERVIYIEQRQNDSYSCGALEGVSPEFSGMYEISVATLTPSCRSPQILRATRPYTEFSVVVYPFVLLGGLLACGFYVTRRRCLIPGTTLLVLTGVYSALGFGADRYSVAIFPAASSVLVLIVFDAFRRVRLSGDTRQL